MIRQSVLPRGGRSRFSPRGIGRKTSSTTLIPAHSLGKSEHQAAAPAVRRNRGGAAGLSIRPEIWGRVVFGSPSKGFRRGGHPHADS